MKNPHYVPPVRTIVPVLGILTALDEGWHRLYKRGELPNEPNEKALYVLGAHWHLETGQRSMWNYNLGNAKGRPGDGFNWTMYRCNEVIDGHTVWFDPPADPAQDVVHQCRFRAFASLEDGIEHYLKLLYKRFARAWDELSSGDPEAFGHALKEQNYYTAVEEHYVRLMLERYAVVRWNIDVFTTSGQSRALEMVGYTGVRDFQRASNEKVDGIVGPATRAALIRAMIAGACT